MARSQKSDTERTPRDTDEIEAVGTPIKGDIYHCDICGMELKVTADCHCEDEDAVKLECCGRELSRA